MNGERSKGPWVLSGGFGVLLLGWLLISVLFPASIEAATLCVNTGGTGG